VLLITILVVEGIAVAQKTQGKVLKVITYHIFRTVSGMAYWKGLQLLNTISVIPLGRSSDLRLSVNLSVSILLSSAAVN